MIKVQSLNKKYVQGEHTINAVDNMDFEIASGQTTSIIGPSGSGKSSLLSLIAGLDKPDSGSISISDQDITKMSEKQMAEFRGKNIGVVFQQFHLMPHLTALENVLLPLELNGINNAEQRALEFLKQVGLENRVHHRPHELSGGECQRVAIARAAVVRPKILLADEPSGNLDAKTGDKVMDLIFKLSEDHGITLILVTHDNDLAKKCNTVLEIQGGKII